MLHTAQVTVAVVSVSLNPSLHESQVARDVSQAAQPVAVHEEQDVEKAV